MKDKKKGMKKTLIGFVVLISININTFSQPNGGFENWFPEYGFESPTSWQTLNFLSLTTPPNPISAYKAIGLDTHSGNFALKIKSIAVTNNPNPILIGDTTSIVYTGKVNLTTHANQTGFPYTGRPENLEFYSKYAPVGNDSALAGVYLRKWNGTIRDTIAKGKLTISSTPTYSLFHVTLDYLSTSIPDTAVIVFLSSKNSSTARVGSTLFIDDVVFNGWVGINESDAYNAKIKIFPNPAKDNITISAEIEDADNVNLIDLEGKIIFSNKIQNNTMNINTGSFLSGIYFCEIRDKKNKILAKNKFTIVK